MKFADKVYKLTKKIPRGRVSTYKEISKALGCKAYRAVGNALNKNPYAPIVPCHRVVNSNGFLGGFASGTKNKIKLLQKEGIKIKNNRIVNFEKVLYKLKNDC
ncbi:MAG: MGMT family protein [Nanoarchaeota archaeon]|nr:MGMT family protein [Nanoarchaeota archaeon]